MSFTAKTLATVILIWTFNLVAAKNIRTGDIRKSGHFDSAQGRREYSVTAHLLRPIVAWEDLNSDGIKIDSCSKNSISFKGNIDSSDFAVGTVLTFPKKQYIKLGCPAPPITNALSKLDQVVFREIITSKVNNDVVVVQTNYVSGASVVPDVELHVGNLLPTSRQLSSSNRNDVLPNYLSRAYDFGINNYIRQGSKPLFTGAKVDWRFSLSAGISNLKFERTKLRASWEQGLSTEASATLDFDRQFRKTARGEIFKAAIPGAGFSIDVFLIGQVTVGISAGIDYEADLETGAAATATFSGGIEAKQKLSVGVSRFDVSALPHVSRSGTATLNFDSPTGSASAFVDGFLGLRPFVEAGLDLPLVGDTNVDVGGTVGLNANVQFNSVPFRPVTVSPTIGVCSSCHSVQGTLDLEGRRLSVAAKVPGISKQEFVIRDKFLDYRIGTLCLFRRTCPAVTPTPSPRPASTCSCRCTTIQSAILDCRNQIPFCEVRECKGLIPRFSCCRV